MPSIGIGIGIALRSERLFSFANPIVGVTAAYSLRIPGGSTYSGPLIRVRRSSDNAESDISASSTADANGNKGIDEAALLAFAGAGNAFVVTWYDQSGAGLNITQATAASQPRIVLSGVIDKQNSKPTLTFSGSQALQTTSATAVITDLTANFVARWTAGTSIITIIDNDSDASAGWSHQAREDLAGDYLEFFYCPYQVSTRAIDTSQTGNGTCRVLTGIARSGVDSRLWTEGTLKATASNAVPCQTKAKFVVGGWGSGGRNLTGVISEVFVFYSALSDTSRLYLERNQGAFFGVTVA